MRKSYKKRFTELYRIVWAILVIMVEEHFRGRSPDSCVMPPRFLCDEMLGRLARYLRAAGYDTLLASGGLPDREWLIAARASDRYFLTMDREVLNHKAAAGIAVLFPHGDLDKLARILDERFGIDWLARAFTRCLVDNSLLVPVTVAEHQLLPSVVDTTSALRCPQCQRLFWAGSHYRGMLARMTRWQAREWDKPDTPHS
ncbi:MAG TPA: Mut7-C RNAse domain-containing protein [Burkholderiales bacterium]|nr:Mut7-C RNAse domain-containing protein [Burkholderiales bacterium]